MDPDISEILRQWDYDPSRINARKIIGKDGKVKVQMRLDLGLLQMEADGRPDGNMPHGCESLLEYHLRRLATHEQQEGSEAGFVLDSEDCAQLQAEGMQYYYRYLCLFAVEDFERAERDTARNLRVFDLVWQHASDATDKWALEQYRPYLIMMNTRAKVSMAMRQGDYDVALNNTEEAIRAIEQFFASHQESMFGETNNELTLLKSWAEQLRESKPPSLEEHLEHELKAALQREDYEAAARIRDQIQDLTKQRPRP